MKGQEKSKHKYSTFESRILKIAISLFVALPISVIMIVTIFNYFIEPLFLKREIIARAHNENYSVECERYNTGAVGPWGIIVETKSPWYSFWGDKQILWSTQLYSDARLSIDDNNMLLINVLRGEFFLTNLDYFEDRYFSFDYELDFVYNKDHSIASTNYAVVRCRTIWQEPHFVSLDIDYLLIPEAYGNSELFVLDADSVFASFLTDKKLFLDIKWTNGEWTRNYVVDLQKLLTASVNARTDESSDLKHTN